MRRWGGGARVEPERPKDRALCVYLTHGCTTLSACQLSETTCQLDTIQLSHSMLFVYVNKHGLRHLQVLQNNKENLFCLCRKSWLNVISLTDFSAVSQYYFEICLWIFQHLMSNETIFIPDVFTFTGHQLGTPDDVSTLFFSSVSLGHGAR